MNTVFLKLMLVALATVPLFAETPDTADVRAAAEGASASSNAPEPESPFGAGAPVALYDFFETASQPENDSPVGAFYQSFVGDYREARGRLETQDETSRAKVAKQTFDGFLGQTSWTAAASRDVVLSMLEWLAARRRDTADAKAAAVYKKLEQQLVGDISARAVAEKRGDLAAALAREAAPAAGWSREAFQQRGVQVWDYQIAAVRILEWMDRRDTLLGSPALAAMLAEPPDPAEPLPAIGDMAREVERLGSAGFGSDPETAGAAEASQRLAKRLAAVRKTSSERSEAFAALAAMLGVRNINMKADLVRLSRRFMRTHRADRAAIERLEKAIRRAAESEAAEREALRRYRADASAARGVAGFGIASGVGSSTLSTGAAADTTAGGGVFDRIDSSTIPARLRKELYKADLSASLKLVDMDVAQGIGISARYRWEIDGNIEDQYATRVDTWEFGTGLRIGDLVRDLIDLPLSVNITAEQKLIMARQFKSKSQAAIALPKTPLGIPLNAERARKMNMGDFWSIPVDLTFATGIGLGYAVGPVSANAGVYYVVSGRFRAQIFKTDPDHVRLRLVATRSSGFGGGGSADAGGIEILGIKILDRALKRLIDLRVFGVDFAERDGTGYSVDYVFDLRDATASEAYERVMKASLKSSPLLAANAIIKSKRIDEAMISDLRPAEEIFHQDSQLEPGRRRVDRVFKGINAYSSRSRSMKLGTRLLRFDSGSSWVENHLRVYAADESSTDYVFPVHSFSSRWSALIGLWKEERDLSLYALMPADPSGKALSVKDLVFSQTLQDKSASRGEMEDYRKALDRSLGASLAEKLDLDTFPAGSAQRFGSQLTFAVHGETIERLLDPARTTETAVWEAAARILPEYDLYRSFNRDGGPITKPWGYFKWSDEKKRAHDLCEKEWGDMWLQLESAIEGFLTVQKSSAPLPDKVIALLKLGKEKTFRVIGARLLIELTDPATVEEAFFVAVGVHAKDRPNFEASLGEDRFRGLYGIINEALYNIADRERR